MRFLEAVKQDGQQGPPPPPQVVPKPSLNNEASGKVVVTQRLYNKLNGGMHRPKGQMYEGKENVREPV